MEWLSAANRQVDVVPLDVLAKDWIPYAYHACAGEISWCLPQGRAVQPFYDEYITHCRQHLVNTLIAPRSSVKSLLQYADQCRELPDPSGFVFHLSRCGSTLVSGCLAQLENCSVLSESPLLTEILLAKNIDLDKKKSLLRLSVYLQGRSSPDRHTIVKWNAWDIFYWEIIREVWSQVPILLLSRDPVEILASHAKSAGRHMSGDSTLAHVNDIFDCSRQCTGLLDYRIKVLRGLMTEMSQVLEERGVFPLDYTALDEIALRDICARFGIDLAPHQRWQIRRKLTRNSKSPLVAFQIDADAKRRYFPANQVRDITSSLSTLHHRLIPNLNK